MDNNNQHNLGQSYGANGQVNGARYGNFSGNYGGDFESQFKNMVAMPRMENAQIGVMEKQPKDRGMIWVIVMAMVAGVGMMIVVWLLVSYIGALREIAEDEELERALILAEGGEDESGSYKDLAFSDDDTDAPLLVYSAIKNGEIVSTDWLEEFKNASSRYAEKYNKKAIPSGAVFGEVTVLSNEVGKLYPYMDIVRFLLETSEGCARFDLYADLLVIYDYEFSNVNCLSAEWNYLVPVQE